MSYHKKVDANQAEIVEFFRQRGASVQSLAAIGKGCPDLLVGWHGQNYLVEVKATKGTLTPDQITWHQMWKGQKWVVHNALEAEELLRNGCVGARELPHTTPT